MRKIYLRLVLLALLTTTLFTACGSDDDNGSWYDYSPELKDLGLTTGENGYLADVLTAERIEYDVEYDSEGIPSRGDRSTKTVRRFNNDGLLEKLTVYRTIGDQGAYLATEEDTYTYENRRLVGLKNATKTYSPAPAYNASTTYIRYEFEYDDPNRSIIVREYHKYDPDRSEELIEKRVHSTIDRQFDYTEYFKKDGVRSKGLVSTVLTKEVRQKDHKGNITLSYFYQRISIPELDPVTRWYSYSTEKFTYRDGSESHDMVNDDITEDPGYTTTKANAFRVDSVHLSGKVKTATIIYYNGDWDSLNEIDEEDATDKYVWKFDDRSILFEGEYYTLYRNELKRSNKRTYKYNTENDKRLTEITEEYFNISNDNLSRTERETITYNDEKKTGTVKSYTSIGENELQESVDYMIYSLTENGFINYYNYKNYDSTTRSLKSTDDGYYEDPYRTVHEKEKVTKQGNTTITELYQIVDTYTSDGTDLRSSKIERYRKVIVTY